MKKYILLATVVLFFNCSDKNRFKVDVSDIKIDFQNVERFEDVFFDISENNISDIRSKYSIFFGNEIEDSIWIKKSRDSLQRILYEDVRSMYSEVSWLDRDLQNLFKHIKYYFPEFRVPKVYTYVDGSSIDSGILYFRDSSYSFIAIPLDLYLGEDYKFYAFIDDYLKKNMTREMIVRDVAFKISEQILNSNKKNHLQFIELAVHHGKIIYMVNSFIPEIKQEVLFGYTSEKLDWAKSNERDMWVYFVKNNILYNSSNDVVKRFIDIAPFSKFYLEIDRKTPGRVGVWYGYNIVSHYVENNEKQSLKEIIDEDNLFIFQKSRYKP